MKIPITFLNTKHELTIDRAHYIRRLGYPKNHDISEEVEASMQWAHQWYVENGTPWMQIYEVDVVLKDRKLYVDGIVINSEKVFHRFQKHQVQKAMLLAMTAGAEVDVKITNLWSSDYPDRSFFLETFSASVTEALVSFAVDYIDQWTAIKNQSALSRYSPGYPGWELKDQFKLMEIIARKENKIPITIGETALLSPLKSQLAFIGIHTSKESKNIDIACTKCSFNNCACKDKGLFIKKQ